MRRSRNPRPDRAGPQPAPGTLEVWLHEAVPEPPDEFVPLAFAEGVGWRTYRAEVEVPAEG